MTQKSTHQIPVNGIRAQPPAPYIPGCKPVGVAVKDGVMVFEGSGVLDDVGDRDGANVGESVSVNDGARDGDKVVVFVGVGVCDGELSKSSTILLVAVETRFGLNGVFWFIAQPTKNNEHHSNKKYICRLCLNTSFLHNDRKFLFFLGKYIYWDGSRENLPYSVLLDFPTQDKYIGIQMNVQ